jgi:hypothetical protein
MTLQMLKSVQLENATPGMNLNQIIMLVNANNERLKTFLQQMWSEIRYKEWIYFTRGKKKWRLGPVGDHLEAQYFIGTNIRDKSQWINDDNWEMEWRSYGGEDA